MNGDWKDALAALQGSLPSGEDREEKGERKESGEIGKSEDRDRKVSSKGKINVSMEKKGRGGKTATIVYGFAETVSDEEIAGLATRLKQRLGTGGSSRGGEILLQGDVREKVKPLLRAEGYKI